MASQVLSGTGNVSYTNNTGQNVRLVINYIGFTGSYSSSMSWTGGNVSIPAGVYAIGKNLATISSGNNMQGTSPASAPTEIMLAPGETFAVMSNISVYPVLSYNIVIIPENG